MSRIIALQIRMRNELPSYQQTSHPSHQSQNHKSQHQSVRAPAGGMTGGFQDESEIFRPKYLDTLTQLLTDASGNFSVNIKAQRLGGWRKCHWIAIKQQMFMADNL